MCILYKVTGLRLLLCMDVWITFPYHDSPMIKHSKYYAVDVSYSFRPYLDNR